MKDADPEEKKLFGEAFDIAINAVEIRTARKPIDTWENDLEKRRKHLCRWACLTCGTYPGFGNKFCTECGRRFDWEV